MALTRSPRGSLAAPVVVGVDGSPASELAARSAAVLARRTLAPLRLVRALPSAIDGPVGASGIPGRADADQEARRSAVRWVERLRADLADVLPALPLLAVVRVGPPVAVLADESRRAQRLVLGTDRPAGTGPGRVAGHLVRRAHCPVQIDRGPGPTGGPVVVGVDCQPGTQDLLAAAGAEASRRGTGLQVVHAWHRRREASAPGWRPGAGSTEDDRVAAAEHRLLERRVEPWRQGHPGVPVELLVEHDLAARALSAAASHAQLLVIGRVTGRRGLPGWQTALEVLCTAPCSLLVVPLAAPSARAPRLVERHVVALT